MECTFWLIKVVKIKSNNIFWAATNTFWVVSFTDCELWSFCQTKSWKLKNTVFGYKKGSKLQYHQTFWSATSILWVVSFPTFDLSPFYQAKSWKTQNTVLDYKKGSKIQSDKIFWSATPKLWVVSFATFASKWPEHRKPMGGGFSAVNPPPMRFEICNFQAESFGPWTNIYDFMVLTNQLLQDTSFPRFSSYNQSF